MLHTCAITGGSLRNGRRIGAGRAARLPAFLQISLTKKPFTVFKVVAVDTHKIRTGMALDTTLFKHLLNVKGTVVEDIEFFHETDGTKSAVVQVHATRGYRCRCRFRNVENLKAMVLLCCSNLVIPLPNHAVSGKPAKQQPSGVVA